MHDILASYFTLAGDAQLTVRGGTEISPHDLRLRIETAAAVGYTGFAFAHKDLQHWTQKYPLLEIRKILDDNGMRVVETESLSGWASQGDERKTFDQMNTELLDWSAQIGARHIKAGYVDGTTPAHARLVESFAILCHEAEHTGDATVALEPIAVGVVRTPFEGLDIIEDAGVKNAGILIDNWHVARAGIPFSHLRSIPVERITSIEVADGAAEPVGGNLLIDGTDHRKVAGAGEFGVEGFIAAILATGYRVPVGDENLSIEFRELPLHD